MKNKRKKVFAAVILFALILLLFSPRIAKAISKNSTFRYVQNNQTELAEIALGVIDGEIKTPYQCDDYTAQYYKAATVKEPIVEFFGRGFGIAPSGCYTGFYYSPKDIPVRFQGTGTVMEAYKNGWAWVYHETGDNNGYTEKICDNWYWFEFYF